jgi:hypothetical protein
MTCNKIGREHHATSAINLLTLLAQTEDCAHYGRGKNIGET